MIIKENNEDLDIFVCRKFKFSSSHVLDGCSKKCGNLHGHNYILKLTLGGQLNKFGLIENLSYISDLVNNNIIKKLDHFHLNDVLDINPTVENLSLWIFNKIKEIIKNETNIANSTYIHMLELEETDKNSALIKNKFKN